MPLLRLVWAVFERIEYKPTNPFFTNTKIFNAQLLALYSKNTISYSGHFLFLDGDCPHILSR